MSSKIWKYSGKLEDFIEHDPCFYMPESGEIIEAKVEGYCLIFWVRFDVVSSLIKRSFKVFGTGKEIPDGFKYRV